MGVSQMKSHLFVTIAAFALLAFVPASAAEAQASPGAYWTGPAVEIGGAYGSFTEVENYRYSADPSAAYVESLSGDGMIGSIGASYDFKAFSWRLGDVLVGVRAGYGVSTLGVEIRESGTDWSSVDKRSVKDVLDVNLTLSQAFAIHEVPVKLGVFGGFVRAGYVSDYSDTYAGDTYRYKTDEALSGAQWGAEIAAKVWRDLSVGLRYTHVFLSKQHNFGSDGSEHSVSNQNGHGDFVGLNVAYHFNG